MIHFPYGSPLTDIELCQLALLYIKIFRHFFKVVGNLVVYIIRSKRIEISIAVSLFIGFCYKLVSHLVVVMAVLAVCVVSGNLFPVFVVQDCGNICFHIFFPVVPAAAIFSDFVRVGKNQIFVPGSFHYGFKFCASNRIISTGHTHYQIIVFNQVPSTPEQIIIWVRHKHHFVVTLQIKGVQVGCSYMWQIQVRIKKIKLMAGKGNRA